MASELIITRIFDAPSKFVWNAWTVPKEAMRWWGPKIFSCPVAKIDFRVGGKYLLCMRGEEGDFTGKEFWSTGIYKEIVPFKKIVCTDSFSDEKGNVVPATHYGMGVDFPMEMKVTVTFEDIDGKTKMTLCHDGHPEGTMTELTIQSWNESFDKLAESLK
ncbi:MAG: SRPBCC domain-containing protein [Nanoarchaeota archaeon]